jgi:hypothetical protein
MFRVFRWHLLSRMSGYSPGARAGVRLSIDRASPVPAEAIQAPAPLLCAHRLGL